MNENATTPSPWWYRNRALVFGAIFGLGFLLGNVQFDPGPSLPAALAWGMRWGDRGAFTLLWPGVALVLLGWLTRLSGTAYVRGEAVFAANVQCDRVFVDGPFRFVRAGSIKPFLRAAFVSESFTLALACGLVPIALAGQAGLIPAAGVFVIAVILFNVVSRAERRSTAA